MTRRYRPLAFSLLLGLLVLMTGPTRTRGANLPTDDKWQWIHMSDGTPFEEPENNPHVPPHKREPVEQRPKPIHPDDEWIQPDQPVSHPSSDPAEPSIWDRVRKILREFLLARGI